MSVTGQPISGTDGRVQFNGQNMNMNKWTATPTVGDIPTRNFEGGGYDEGITGFIGVEIDIEGFYDRTLGPFALLGLKPGVIVAALKVFVSKTYNSFFNFPQFRLLSTPVTNDVDDKYVAVSFKIKSDGPFSWPTV